MQDDSCVSSVLSVINGDTPACTDRCGDHIDARENKPINFSVFLIPKKVSATREPAFSGHWNATSVKLR
ncbi:MAG: hypothetical protein ABW202_00625, partial [Duganella sp.]